MCDCGGMTIWDSEAIFWTIWSGVTSAFLAASLNFGLLATSSTPLRIWLVTYNLALPCSIFLSRSASFPSQKKAEKIVFVSRTSLSGIPYILDGFLHVCSG